MATGLTERDLCASFVVENFTRCTDLVKSSFINLYRSFQLLKCFSFRLLHLIIREYKSLVKQRWLLREGTCMLNNDVTCNLARILRV